MRFLLILIQVQTISNTNLTNKLQITSNSNNTEKGVISIEDPAGFGCINIKKLKTTTHTNRGMMGSQDFRVFRFTLLQFDFIGSFNWDPISFGSHGHFDMGGGCNLEALQHPPPHVQ